MTNVLKPILFSTEMVKAIIIGKKTQTRRIVKNKDVVFMAEKECLMNAIMLGINRPGHVFWVRETWQHTKILNLHPSDANFGYVYKADGQPWDDFEGWKWKPSLFMPKEACRIFLRITRVDIERLNSISENDAVAEGVDSIAAFRSLWASINGSESLNSNPWVFVYEFERISK